MLIGQFAHNVDAKGRVFIPAKWREDLGDTIILTRGIRGKGETRCLLGMSLKAWEAFSARFSDLPMTDLVAQNARRMIFANACDCELDKQGRVLLSAGLRQYAGIDKDAVLIGMGNRIEIWSQERWLRWQEKAQDDMGTDALAYLAELGI